MNFKEIRLVGFKSFADKTSVKLDDGVTCIVGPNGCGKSNVADAVRWVLGEQSAKTLRGSSMQDVIFGGTESRRSLSFCEVSLVFDNTDRIFDTDYQEIEITRRLYRSGDSVYLINKEQCRLKDIVTILHSAGIGKDGYSIIGQGKVEQIMNAKPEDRRAIFEEATGVMEFKTKRGEIERKVASIKDNLSIQSQRIDEAESQLRPLERQAETAIKFREYSERLKYEEVNAFLVRSDSFEQETEKQREIIRETEERLQQVETRLSEIDRSETESREKILGADAQLRTLNDKLRLFEVEVEHKSGETRLIKEKINSYLRQNRAASEDIEYSLRRTSEIDNLTLANKKKAEESEKRAKEIEERSIYLSERLREADAHVAAYERVTDEKRASELSSVENLANIRKNAGSLSAQRDATSERIEEVKAAIQKAAMRKNEFEAELNACLKSKGEVVAFLDSKDEKERAISEEIADLTRSEEKVSDDIVSCHTSIANLKNNLEFYTNLRNRFEGYRESVRRLQLASKENAEIGKRVKGAIADIVRCDKKYEVAIETAFGAAMQNLVTATADDARYLIEYLKRNHGGIVTFLPVESMRPYGNTREIRAALNESGAVGLAESLVSYDPYYENVIKNLLGNTLIADTIGSATEISKKYPRAFKIVTLDGDTIATSGAMTGGSRRKDSGNLLAGERNIKECEEEIARKEATIQKLQSALDDCKAELTNAKAAREQLRLSVQENAATFAALSQKELTLTSLVGEAEHDKTEYEALLSRLSQRADDLQSEALSTAENEDLLNKIRQEAAAEASAREAEISKLRQERDAIQREFNALQVERAAIVSSRQADADTARRLEQEKVNLVKKIEDSRAAILETDVVIEQLKREEEKVALTEEEQRTVNALRERISVIEEDKKKENEFQAQFQTEKRSLLARQITLGEDKHAAEIEISKSETTLENMRQRIDEAYALSYESAKELRDENYDFTGSQTNITRLRHQIAALGPVNHNAEKDYQELLEHTNDMKSQREDVEKALADTETALEQLKEHMLKQFNEGFEKINDNFTRVFRELFGGGRAEMRLDYTDCPDPLDAGIEIEACPPGKKLTKISLLSGGERAFTAIAILFAILKSRPMPFCILDEIEAALDEANVDRFARYLKKFSQDTQFIVITHRKPTMNQADTLFGITMEEKGVSKLVSVRLSEVEERLGGATVI